MARRGKHPLRWLIQFILMLLQTVVLPPPAATPPPSPPSSPIEQSVQVEHPKPETEPFDLVIDGHAYPIGPGSTVAIDVNGTNVAVTLKPRDVRTVQVGGLEFSLPSGFDERRERDAAGLTVVAFESPTTLLMIFEFPQGSDGGKLANMFPQSLAERFGDKLVSEMPFARKVNSTALRGRRIEAQISGETVVQEVFLTSTDGVNPLGLVIQYSMTADGQLPLDFERLINSMNQSLTTNRHRSGLPMAGTIAEPTSATLEVEATR